MERDDDFLLFCPVPLKARHDGWTPERQRAFVMALAKLGCVAAAARSVGKSAQTAYALRKRNGAESFAEAWDRAVEMGENNAMDLAFERAIHGEERKYFYQGRHAGTYRRYDNRLLCAALRAHDKRYAGVDRENCLKDYYNFMRK